MQAPAESAAEWEVQLIRYYNRYSWIYYTDTSYYYYNRYGYCCDVTWYYYSSSYCRYYQCDNYFDICIRSYGAYTVDTTSSCTFGQKQTPIAGDDSFSFSSTSIGLGSTTIDNPIIFTYTGNTSPVSPD